MPEFKQNRGYQMKGTDLYDKVQKPNGNGFYMKKKGDTDPKKVKQDAKDSTHKGTSKDKQEAADFRAKTAQEKADRTEKHAQKLEKFQKRHEAAGGKWKSGKAPDQHRRRANIEADQAKKAKEEAERLARLSKGSGKPGPYEGGRY